MHRTVTCRSGRPRPLTGHATQWSTSAALASMGRPHDVRLDPDRILAFPVRSREHRRSLAEGVERDFRKPTAPAADIEVLPDVARAGGRARNWCVPLQSEEGGSVTVTVVSGPGTVTVSTRAVSVTMTVVMGPGTATVDPSAVTVAVTT
jgi:hypothetical protein